MKPRFIVVVLSVLVAVHVSGCAAKGETGRVDFSVSDKDIDDFQNLFITITQVTMHKAGGADTTTTSTGDEITPAEAETNESARPDSTWTVITDTAHTVDLLQFTGGATDLVGTANVSAGKYTQIRLAVSAANGTLENGSKVAVVLPSKTLKIVRPFTVEAGKTLAINVDFELDRSIVIRGDGQYMLKPTLKLTLDHDATPRNTKGR